MQGSFVVPDAFGSADVELLGLSDADILVVISQSCDVIHCSFDVEPFVELLPLRRIALNDLEGNNTFGKNPRVLDLEEVTDGEKRAFRCAIREKIKLPRKYLLGKHPKGTIGETNIQVLADWTARRYTRPAFPDEFNERRRPALRKLKSTMKQASLDVTAVYVRLSSYDELPPDEPYKVILIATVLPEVAEDFTLFERAQKATEEVRKALNACDGINVVTAETRSEDDVSLAERRLLQKFEFEDISLRFGGPSAPPE